MNYRVYKNQQSEITLREAQRSCCSRFLAPVTLSLYTCARSFYRHGGSKYFREGVFALYIPEIAASDISEIRSLSLSRLLLDSREIT